MLSEDKKASQVAIEHGIRTENFCCFLNHGISNGLLPLDEYKEIIKILKSEGRINPIRHSYCKDLPNKM